MYSFQPLVDRLGDVHFGFYFVCVVLAILTFIVLAIWNDRACESSTMLVWLFGFAIVGYAGYKESYRPIVEYENTPVKATLVGFQPEGYNEKHGKSRADEHYMYVVYDVGGERVILRASEGQTYPKQVTLYKN